ncbi:MAG TPA: hypothetical protein EYH02_03625 [Ignisphaera aggregans]|uniref:Uncharacterized protein n=1 Tax=Ignisphaera aggregans TaxID=334771 RepID=A0A832Z3E6_9CREN|nr:hypothetical protein [Ignisphaera aggregans]
MSEAPQVPEVTVPEERVVEEKQTLVDKLENLLKSMKDWERRPIIEVGKAVVEIVKLPKRQTKKGTEPERLALHLRLKDSFKGIFVESYDELDDILRALNSKTVHDIAKALDELSKRRVIEYGL